MPISIDVARVTDRVRDRSRRTRAAYLDLIERERDRGAHRPRLSCGNLAHGFAAAGEDKPAIVAGRGMNIGLVTAYNDMLSAHQPYGRYPEQMKLWAREAGATVQVAGGVPAMCDGVTQGQPGMELSLFSRDTIAMSTAIALSHGMFEGAVLLGICDKIVPGLLIGALRFGHLPTVFIPSGPMASGLPNKEKARIRQLYAEGKASEADLLECESASYHSAGTCTFYGTANSNQMMMEVMGLHVPGAAFVPPNGKLRQELTRAAVHRLSTMGWTGNDYRPLGQLIDERAIVNAAVGLLATGGSTNHAIHLPAMAAAAGIAFDWTDLDELSAAVPLIARVYPNGSGDVNDFQAAGGMAFVIGALLDAGLLHDLPTIWEGGSRAYAAEPALATGDAAGKERLPGESAGGGLAWSPITGSRDPTMLRAPADPFQPDGGMRLVRGNLGRATFKTSAVAPDRWTIEAPARVFADQEEVVAAFKRGELDRDVVVVVRFQGPRANGMPELHKLTPSLGSLQDRGFRVALVTDGRMSGASGKVPAAIHLSPEALGGGPLARLRDGDVIRLCATRGTLDALVPAEQWAARPAAVAPPPALGTGRELFAFMRAGASSAEEGGSAMLAHLAAVAATGLETGAEPETIEDRETDA
jgi:phosphogluconate dehydratase